ncbi:cobalamin synthase (plasmid) [Acidiphilium multivorum AIU301]|uniref:Adenosylcobinamide-GDP ribazoletransferase n=1 Tax=Acidiphilium multivorum (strain DSM 11245 / JCM 8867 / NBRC 100883 / AIU 301) TaxID=926570 RepID=F0J704_ACIMA|nr:MULTISPECIES: adenosylcobinamide-GDP ribazoletransferase [Acidiphilium]EGO96785.1 Putative Cobalamin (5'-phosphate) synthase [Acidiphilium sp. PM]BAJ82871.1 cobalamin synthase [Acidiphilium multivorum AIU301]GAN73008.1 cobalamin (5'-phosphate) synthase [Acidiphilium multivorum AIU301]
MSGSWIQSRTDEARLALMLLTRMPMGRLDAAPTLAAAAWAYPLAGAAVGAVAGLVYLLAAGLGLASLPSALLAVAAGVVATGGMHEDGLADLADGFGGGGDRTRKLEIMRDSRVGSYGVIALCLALLLRVVLLAEVLPGHAPLFVLLGLGALSRAPLPVLMRLLPAARAEGLGHSAALRIGAGQAAAAALTGFVLAALFLPLLLCPVLAAAAAAALTGLLARRQIGGFTGDVLGAAQIAAELAALLALAAA